MEIPDPVSGLSPLSRTEVSHLKHFSLLHWASAFCISFACCAPLSAAPLDFFSPYDWTGSSCTGPNVTDTCTWTASSPFGTVTATSSSGWRPGGSGGTNFTPPLTTEFSVAHLGASVTITLPGGLNWGPGGGELILGNVHNGFAYSLSASDGTNAIDVNAWTVLGEDLNSTSTTSLCAGGTVSGVPSGTCSGPSTSMGLYVYDLSASPGSGQGGVVAFGGLPSSVRTISLTLTSNDVGGMFPSGGQGSDFIIFNVGPAVPEPSSMALLGLGAAFLSLGRLRRKRI